MQTVLLYGIYGQPCTAVHGCFSYKKCFGCKSLKLNGIMSYSKEHR